MPVTVAVGSLFRNSARTLDYYRGLWSHQLGEGEEFDLTFSFVEGDSTDATWKKLSQWALEDPRVTLGKMDVEPVSGFEDRVRKWAILGNAVIDALHDKEWDWFLWCESDLCLPPDLVTQLLVSDKDIVAPAIHLGGFFYDTWGFRGLDGRRFNNAAPLHPAWHPFGLNQLRSVGSVVLFRRSVIDSGIRFRGVHENGLLVGMCDDARALGFEVWADSRVSVIHPTSLWVEGQYLLGRIEVRTATHDAGADEIWRPAIDALRASQHPILGTPNVPDDHAAFDGVRKLLEQKLPGREFSVGADLLTESPKRYVLVITDRTEDAVSCRSAPTP